MISFLDLELYEVLRLIASPANPEISRAAIGVRLHYTN